MNNKEEKPKCPECLQQTSQEELNAFAGLCETCYEQFNGESNE